MLKAGVVIPTLNAEKELQALLPKVLEAFSKENILVIDSSSEDATLQVATSFGIPVKVVKRETFNHGLTRELGRKILGGDIVIFLTQDALPIDKNVFKKIIEPIEKGIAVVSYGRQIPKNDAHPFEKFLRKFNYPEKGEIRSLKDFFNRGSAIYFCSNTFAAYSNQALDELGGFPKVSFGEDTLVVAKMLEKGGAIAYIGEPCVIHSHDFSFWSEFKRYRLMGKERRLHLKYFGVGETRRGWLFAKELLKETPLVYWPYAFAYLAVKGIGFFTAFL